MKTVIFVILSFAALSSFSQAVFHMRQPGYHDIDEIMAIEGDSYTMTTSSDNLVWNYTPAASGGQALSVFSPALSVGQGYYIRSIVLGVSQAASGNIKGLSYNIGNYPANNATWASSGGSATINCNCLINSYQKFPIITLNNVPAANPASTIAYSSNLGIYVTKGSVAGGSANFNIGTLVVTVHNNNASPTSGTITINDSIPPGCIFDSVNTAASGWTATKTAKGYTVTSSAVIAAGATSTYTLTVQANTTISISATIYGTVVGDDIGYQADSCMAIMGTSIDRHIYATADTNSYIHKLRNYLRDSAATHSDFRISFRGPISGSQSSQADFLREYLNYYQTATPCALFVIDEGINDAGQGIDTNTYKNNILRSITWYLQKNPSGKVLLMQPIPNGITATEALLATQYRPALTNLYNSLSTSVKSHVYYENTLGALFNPTTQGSLYFADYGTNLGTHPNNAGYALMWQDIRSQIISNGWVF